MCVTFPAPTCAQLHYYLQRFDFLAGERFIGFDVEHINLTDGVSCIIQGCRFLAGG